MEFITGILLALAAVVAGMYYFSPKNRKLRRIPGPSGYPVVGNALQMEAMRPHETLSKWAKEYRDVMKINLFGDDIIVANSLESIKEVLVTKSNDYAGRPPSYRARMMLKDKDIIFEDMNPKWSFMKKASMTGLKQVGDVIKELEDILQGFLDDLVQTLAKWEGKTVNIKDAVDKFVNHATFTLVHGRALTTEDHNLLCTISQRLSECFNPNSEFASLETLPFLRGPWCSQYRRFMEYINQGMEFYNRHSATTIDQYDDEIRCALDGMVKEMKQPSIANISQITYGNIDGASINVINAGVLTTSSALYYMISLMAAKPDLQEETYEHIIKGIGHRSPTLKDRFSIPYIESAILEVLRLMSHVPVSIPHKTLKDTTLNGYEIPAGTQVWPNLWHLHHDERLWEDPWEFKPKRFLDEDGDLVKADHPLRKQFYAFGAGRRVCTGESLAKHRLFLFFVTIMQKFKFLAPEGEKIITDPREFELAFVLNPMEYNVRIEIRQ